VLENLSQIYTIPSYRIALQRVENALRDSYKDRKRKKRDFRALWIQQINAALRRNGYKYSEFIAGLKRSGYDLNRKVLSDLAINDLGIFDDLASKCINQS
jgi:large subunit ribosomal protein L20